MKPKAISAADNISDEIVLSRTFAAPRELVFRAWTEPAHLAQWWGPRGFSNPVCECDARPGGKIHVVMRAPNGTDYPMGGEYREIVAPEKLVFTTGALDGAGKMMFEFLHTLTFTVQEGKTLLTLRSRLIRTSPGSDQYTNGFRAGLTQSWDRLADLVEDTADREVISEREFAAPPEAVFAAFSDPARLALWWGPHGFTNTFRIFELRVGGRWEFTMHGPDGANYDNISVFREISAPRRIIFEHLEPMHWYQMTMTFAATSGGTRLAWRMVFASAAECDRVRPFIVQGNEQNFDRLAADLSAPGPAVR